MTSCRSNLWTFSLAKMALVVAASAVSPAHAGDTAKAKPSVSALEIMEKVALTRKLDGSEAVVTMTIHDGKGEKRERKLALATKLYDEGKTEKRIYRFLEPADVKGTGVLTFDYEDKGDDMWIFLPALRKTRRIVSAQKSKSFMGSEFTYADMNIPVLNEFDYRLLPDEKLEGSDCWVIEVTPKAPTVAKEEGYSKKVFWISKAEYAIRKGMYYDLGGKLLKELHSNDVKLLDEKNRRYRSMYMEMVNKQNGRRSEFRCEKIQFTPATDDTYFTTRYLERP